ncbi:hypothetical protein [Agromyces binzhouensis]|uniref:hypothetical protein n=1 Tax=Agromyces binzhouensis TaxID=1817495 RepID=UPI00362AEC0A
MSFGVLVWMEEIVVGIVALVLLGLLLIGVRASRLTSASQSWVGRVASVIAVAGVIAFWWQRWSAYWFGTFDEGPDWRYAFPIMAAIAAIAVMALAGVRPVQGRSLGEVDLAPRSLWSFGARSWFLGWSVVTVLMAATVVLAGSASSAGEDGRYTMFVIKLGESTAGTSFFGWTYGTPVLVALGIQVVLVLGALWLIALPAVPADPMRRELDRAGRRNRTRTVLALAAGATSFTLGQSWLFIGRSAQLGASLSGYDGTRVDVGTSFAALALPFMILGLLLEGIGVALLLLPLLQPRRRQVRVDLPRPAADAPAARVA